MIMHVTVSLLLLVGCGVSLSHQTSEPMYDTPPQPQPTEMTEPRCLEAPATGVCRAAIPMFYYNATTLSCQEFIWGGCPGSKNKFPNREACMRTCAPSVCKLVPQTGPCRANIRMWYYDASHHTCKEFSYGGCEGNDNSFPTEEQCLAACGGSSVPCELGSQFETVGWKAVNSNPRHTEWLSYRCEGRCRKMCVADQPWGTCLAFSLERKWYMCSCFLYDRFLSDAEFDSGSKGVTRNRKCAFTEAESAAGKTVTKGN